MTEELFRLDSYLSYCDALVVSADSTGIELDRTVFYATGGSQPGDKGILRLKDGREIDIYGCQKDRESGRHIHIPAEGAVLPAVGESVIAEIDWARRHKLMRMHSCLHLLCAIVDGGVTGGQVGEEKSRLDFDLEDTSLDREALTDRLNRLIIDNHAVKISSIRDAELAANPDLVRTMSVQPPTGTGKVRLISIGSVDLQPCGGTHVQATGEIGPVRVGKIENKGKHNRRINVHLET